MEAEKVSDIVLKTDQSENNVPGIHVAIAQAYNLHVGTKIENEMKPSYSKKSSMMYQSQSIIRQCMNIIRNAIGGLFDLFFKIIIRTFKFKIFLSGLEIENFTNRNAI